MEGWEEEDEWEGMNEMEEDGNDEGRRKGARP